MSFEYFGGHCPPDVQLVLGGIIIKKTCNGRIYKSQAKSFIKKFSITSTLADELFSEKPCMDGKEVVVLQVVNFGEGMLLAEIVYKKDYDEHHSVGIYKLYAKSIIKYFHLTSIVAGEIFDTKPAIDGKEVVVLQVVRFGNDGMIMAEIIYKSDYDEA